MITKPQSEITPDDLQWALATKTENDMVTVYYQEDMTSDEPTAPAAPDAA